MGKRRIALSAFLVLVMIFPTASPIANAESQIIEVTKVAYSRFTASQSGATLTGVLTDRGVDDDADGLFEYLELGVQVNVATEGYYGIEVKGLATSNSTLIGIRPEVYISPYKAGLQEITVQIYGPWIHSFGLNPAKVLSVCLKGRSNNLLMEIKDIELSREYSYNEFHPPGARLTGLVTDRGTDEDADGKYEFLEVNVEVNVTKAPEGQPYTVSMPGDGKGPFGFYKSGFAWELGVSNASLLFHGGLIHSTQADVSVLPQLTLTDENGKIIQMCINVSLSRTYSYTEFDPPEATMTGRVGNRGVDLDGDGKFDKLEIEVEVDVEIAGQYYVAVLESENVGGAYYTNLGVGRQNVTISLNGPTIYACQRNPETVKIQLHLQQYGYLELSHQLSRKYTYEEFDEPQVAVGDWVKYKVNATWSSTDPNAPEPDQIKEQRQVEWMRIEVTDVTNIFTMSQTNHYRNGTEKSLPPITGSPEYSFLMYIVQSGLKQGDTIRGGYVSFDPVEITQGTYAGMERSLAHSGFAMSFFGFNITLEMYWDRTTGILCEMNNTVSRITEEGSTRQTIITKMAETNLWKTVTHISCTTLTETVKEGNSVHVSGMIDAGLSGSIVTLTYVKPDGSTVNRTSTTDSMGAFSDSYALDAAGSWKVSASWMGDSNHTGAASQPSIITVTPLPFFETSLGMAVIGIVVFVIVAPAAFLLLRMRRRKQGVGAS